jgi:hypothetical protein
MRDISLIYSNCLIQSRTFKVRLIQLKAGGEILPCAMAMNVSFYVLREKDSSL